MYGDTLYSYHSYTDNSVNGGDLVTDAPLLNWIYFTPNYTGNWHYKQGITHDGNSIVVPNVVAPDWSWSPNESEDSWDYGKCSIAMGNELFGNRWGSYRAGCTNGIQQRRRIHSYRQHRWSDHHCEIHHDPA